jgi:hypothetical protein
MTTSALTQVRLALLAAGFTPTPVDGKIPPMPGWQEKLNPTVEEVASWERGYPHCRNTGILTRDTGTFDIDILKPEAAEAIEELVRERFGNRGKLLVRVGKAPKRAIPFRAITPFNKLSAKFRGGDKLEFLCDGQMVVVHGTHPDTKRPYTWQDGALWEVEREDLAYVTGGEAQQLIDDAADLLMEEFGYDLAKEDHPPAHVSLGDAVVIDVDGEPWRKLVDQVLTSSDYHEALRDLAAKLIAKGVDEGEAVERLQKLMERSEGPRDKRWQERYDDIPRAVSTAKDKFAPVVTLDDFRAYMPDHDYIYMPTREHWPASSVNSRLPHIPVLDPSGNPIRDRHGNPARMKPSAWLDRNRPVEQMAWAPGEPELVRDRLIVEGGWIHKPKVTCLNLYRPPTIELGNAREAQRWVDLVRKLYPDDAEHIIDFFAHRRQRPHEKINHALVLGGKFGIGKDTLIAPLRQTVGPWNFKEVSPHIIFEAFNPYMKSTVLHVSEARDQGDQGRFDRFQFFERMKNIIVTPPEVTQVNEKHIRQYYVFNRAGVVVTANRKDSFYLPADDRRHYVAWSTLETGHATPEFWRDLYRWYEGGGYGHVAAYLAQRDISEFNPKAPPEKTTAFWEIVSINRPPEDAELADALTELGNPDAVTILQVTDTSLSLGNREFFHYLRDRKHARAIPHRMGECGYVPLYNETQNGRWKVGAKKHVVYVKAELTLRQRHEAVKALTKMADDDIKREENEWAAREAGTRTEDVVPSIWT